MAYTPINNGDLGLVAREKINGIGTGLDTHEASSGSSVHGLGTVSTQSASALELTNLLTVSGSITASGYITGKKSGVFAFLTGSAITTITTSGSYYAIEGIFDNDPVGEFTFVATPAVKYIGIPTEYFKIDWHTTFSSDHTSCRAILGIKKNGEIIPASLMSAYLKTSTEPISLGGVLVVELAAGDEIQLVATSDNNGDKLTFLNYTTSMNRFF